MEGNRKKIDVFIDGRRYTVLGDCSEDYIISMGNYVDKKIRELTAKNAKLSQTMAATLAALNITDELYKTREDLYKLESESKEPIEKHDDLLIEIEELKEKLNDMEKSNTLNEEKFSEMENENERLKKENIKFKQSIDLKERELGESESMIKSLQEKIFNNQLEFIENKKELMELKKSLETKEEEKK